MAGKTVAAEKQRSLIDWSSGNRIDAPGGAPFHCRFNVSARSFSGCTRLNTRLDKTVNVVEVKDDRFGKLVGDGFPQAHNVITRLKVERTSGVGQQLGIADNYRNTHTLNFFFS